MTLKEVVQKSLALRHADLADELASYPAPDFYATVGVMLVGIPELNQEILSLYYGLQGEEKDSRVKRVTEACFPHLSANATQVRIMLSLQLLLHPVRLEILRRAIQGQPFTLEGKDRPTTFLDLSTRALTVLARAGIYSEQDLAKSYASSKLLTISQLSKRIYAQIEAKLHQTS